ncbi:MAG: hypothetical protein J6A97_00645 [Clostridia bacterium]|nr:hypothetical protein [Clostridia bacterium]
MIYRIFNINDMTEELASHYFPLMTEGKRAKILGAKDKLRGAQAFVADMLARQCLSEFADAPEFSFSLLINPDSKSIVSNFNAEISVSTAEEYVACAVSDVPVGISIVKAEPFTFSDAQSLLTDSEIRYLFSFSKHSLTENISKESCDEPILTEKYSLLKSLKTAQFLASGRGIRERRNNASFDFFDNSVICSNIDYKVRHSEYISEKKLSLSVIDKNIK